MNGQAPTDMPRSSPCMTLIRAFYDWALEEGMTPLVFADPTSPEVEVPMDHAKEGGIVLNIHPDAVRDLVMENGYVLFSARFSGRAVNITLPVESVRAVYARETGQGVLFQANGSAMTFPASGDGPGKSEGKPPPATVSAASHLKVVK